MVVIRAARKSDGHVLAQIDHAGWSPSTDPGELWPLNRPFFGDPTETRVEDVLVASEHATPVGFIKIQPKESAFGDWYIAGLGVAEEQRRRGIGGLLVRAALARAAEAAAHGVWLKVLSSNTPALRLYQSCGFVEADRCRARFMVNRRPVDDLRLVITLG